MFFEGKNNKTGNKSDKKQEKIAIVNKSDTNFF